MMKKQISLLTVLILVSVAVSITAVSVWAITTLKTIHGTALVVYAGDITVEDFKFKSDTSVLVTISTTLASKPACIINVSGAGISGSASVSAGWSSPSTITVPITGTLTSGTITIEVS